MARYPAEHKQQTRERILTTAGRRFRRGGVDGSGVAAIMADSGLTNGAFYSHFDSKEHLVAEVVADQVAQQAEWFERAAERPDGLDRVIDTYLSTSHRDDLEGGCLSAALIGELAHAPHDVRARYTLALGRTSDAFRRLSGLDSSTPQAVVLARLAILIGTLQIARAIDDPEVSASVLEEGKKNLREIAATGVRPSGGSSGSQ